MRDLAGPFVYRWSTSGTYGFVDDYTNERTSVEGTSEAAFYQVEDPLAIESGHSDTVTVEVFPRAEGGGIAPDAVPIGKPTAVVTHKQRNLDSRWFVQPGSMLGFRTGPVPCAVMMLRFPKEPGATSYTITLAGYGGVGDRDYNSNSHFVAEGSYQLTVLGLGERIELWYDWLDSATVTVRANR